MDELNHIIGAKDELIEWLPDLTAGFSKDARKRFTEREKMALIDEDGMASNSGKLDIQGTHYERQSPSEIAMSILPLKGL